MRDRPTYADAAILIALTCGGDPERVLAATDHLNAGYCESADWAHACALLGRLGLLMAGDPLPASTTAGREIAERHCPPGTPPRLGASQLQDALRILPVIAEPVLPPDRKVIDDAIDACERARERWQLEEDRRTLVPDRADAWLLLALVNGKGDPERTLASADHLNAAYPTQGEWRHACAVLSRMGLINPGDPLPLITADGESLARQLSGGGPPSRATPDRLFAILKELSYHSGRVAPPDSAVLNRAAKALETRSTSYMEDLRANRLPVFRDAWLLVSLHRDEAIDWKSVSTGDEDGPATPSQADWCHAIVVLSMRDLVTLDGGVLKTTPAGARLVEGCVAEPKSNFRLVLCVLEETRRTSTGHPMLPAPSPEALHRLESSLGWLSTVRLEHLDS